MRDERKMLIIVIILGILILISAFQAIELVEIKKDLSSISLKPSQLPSAQASVSRSIQNLPTMVGGC